MKIWGKQLWAEKTVCSKVLNTNELEAKCWEPQLNGKEEGWRQEGRVSKSQVA